MTDLIRILAADPDDLPFIRRMVYEAFYWDPDATRPSYASVEYHPEFAKLLAEWGRKGDRAVIAQRQGERLGAAWFRLWMSDHHSYGFIDAETPELGIAVCAHRRSQGIGRKLLRSLLVRAHEDGFSAISLSVSPRNFARALYESEGFVKVGESGTSWTMRRALDS